MIEPETQPLDRDVEPSQLIISLLEKKVLSRLQSGEETHLVVAQKQPHLATLPPLPGLVEQENTSRAPVLRKAGVGRDRWQKEPLLGFVYVVRGEVDFLLSQRIVTCHAGNFVLFLPHTWSDRGTVARWKQSDSARSDCDLLWLYVRPQEVLTHTSWLHGTDLHGVKPVGMQHLFIPDTRILSLVELLHEEVTLGPVGASASQILWLIYDRVRRKLREGHFLASRLPVQETTGASGKKIESIGQRAQRYVDANLMQRMTLESVARALFTSRARLSREFQEHTGETFAAYLLRRRIQRAQHLLTTTSCSIKEIAWRTGFPDPDYFCAAFRRMVGSTPTAFRKKRR